MDRDAVLARFDRELRRDAPPGEPGAVVERIGDVVRQDGGEHGWCAVLWSDLDEAGADAAIAEQVRYFGALDRDFEWKHYGHDRPADLSKRLLAAGFLAEPTESLMVARVSELPTEVTLPEGVRLRTATDRTALELMARVHEQAFGDDPGRLSRRLLAMLSEAPETLSLVVAMTGEEPVCAARMELVPGTAFAGLWGGGTVPGWRGRGIYRALVAHRARLAAELGYRFLQVDASDQSRPILERLGFTVLSTTTPYLRQPVRSQTAASTGS